MKTIHQGRAIAISGMALLLPAAIWGQTPLATAARDKIVSAVERPAPIKFTPMTEAERLRQYLKRSFGPEALIKSAAGGGLGQWKDRPEEWGQGGLGYTRRFASSYAEHLTETSLEFGASNLLREDNRYFVSERTGKGNRILYAIESPFLARHNDGTRHISLSHIGAVVGAALISRAWQPPSTSSIRSAGLNAVTSLSVSMGFDVAREFWPRK